MDTRQKDLEILREMKKLDEKIGAIVDELVDLDMAESDVTLDENQYRTDNAQKYEDLKKMALQESFEKFQKEEKAKVGKFALIPWLGIALGIVVYAFVFKNVFVALGIAAAGFVLKAILATPVKKRISREADAEAQKIYAEYTEKIREGEILDKKEEKRYEKDLEAAREKNHRENQAKRDELEAQKEELECRFEEIQILSEDDMADIDALIGLLVSRRADNIKEALLALDREKQRKAEETRAAAEAARAAAAAEAARQASMPGTVYVRIGSINTYSGALQNVSNAVYIDGSCYGAGSAGGSTIQLNPGPHTVYGQLQEAGYIFTSPTQSFVLSGNGEAYVKIMIKNARAVICLCDSRSEWLSN